MIEIWKPIENHPKYEVSNLGRIRKIDNACVRKFRFDKDGYLLVTLDHKRRIVHRLVMATFVGPAPAKAHVRHLDGNPANNVLGNLAYGTQKQNEADKFVHGTALIGEKNHQAKLTREQVLQIRSLAGLKPKKVVAREFGISPLHVRRIQNGEKWTNALQVR